MISLILVLVRCLIETIIFEVGIAYLLGFKDKDLLFVVLVNIFTNPIVVYFSLLINFKFGLDVRNIALVFLELFAFLSEGIIYKYALKEKKINPFVLSLVLNASSYGIGELINLFI